MNAWNSSAYLLPSIMSLWFVGMCAPHTTQTHKRHHTYSPKNMCFTKYIYIFCEYALLTSQTLTQFFIFIALLKISVCWFALASTFKFFIGAFLTPMAQKLMPEFFWRKTNEIFGETGRFFLPALFRLTPPSHPLASRGFFVSTQV